MLEIKTTSEIHDNVDDYIVYLVQLLFYMQYLGVAKGLLAVYERPEDFDETFDKDRLQLHFIDIDNYKELLEKINKAVEQFRIDLEKIKENPFITEEELLPNEIVTLSNQVLDLEKALKSYDEIKAKYEKFKEQLRQAMIDKGIKNWETPNKTKITVILDSEDKTIEEEYYDEEKFIKENAELHENYHNKLAEYKKTREVIKKGKKVV